MSRPERARGGHARSVGGRAADNPRLVARGQASSQDGRQNKLENVRVFSSAAPTGRKDVQFDDNVAHVRYGHAPSIQSGVVLLSAVRLKLCLSSVVK